MKELYVKIENDRINSEKVSIAVSYNGLDFSTIRLYRGDLREFVAALLDYIDDESDDV